MITFRSLMVGAGMTAYLLPTPSTRLAALSIGTWNGWLAMTGTWNRCRGHADLVMQGRGTSGSHLYR